MTTRLSERQAAALGLPARKRSKYGAKATVVDGVWFASQAEANHWCLLKRRQHVGEIVNLQRQVKYPLLVGKVQIGTYIADFLYWDNALRRLVVVDVKGMLTPLYRRNKKHMKAQYGIDILEVT